LRELFVGLGPVSHKPPCHPVAGDYLVVLEGSIYMADVSWDKELEDLVATATTAADKVAVEAFAKAIKPHLDNPVLLRTLLGKITRNPVLANVGIVVADHNFPDLDALRGQMPANVNVVEL